jgi:hypothetical protein
VKFQRRRSRVSAAWRSAEFSGKRAYQQRAPQSTPDGLRERAAEIALTSLGVGRPLNKGPRFLPWAKADRMARRRQVEGVAFRY